MEPRSGLLLINLGTPESPRTDDVRRYLREFLSDPRVIDIAGWARALLLNLVILPFRPRKSAEAYRSIWTDRGSPLLIYGKELRDKLQALVGPEVPVVLAMRYQKPSLADALDQLQAAGVERIVAFPLFPHYASSSFGSAVEALYAEAGKRNNTPFLDVFPAYYDHPAFLRALTAVTRKSLAAFQPDKLLISFHGLPERHMRASDPTGAHCLASDDCCAAMTEANRYCYRAQCYATARSLAAALGLPDSRWEVAFQSRLGRDPWIRPFTDERIAALPGEGVKRLAVAVPSFVADCLETLEEIAMRGQEDFVAAGGEELALVPCLNAEDVWVRAVGDMLSTRLGLQLPPAESEAEDTPGVPRTRRTSRLGSAGD
jgi:ferrochelatase